MNSPTPQPLIMISKAEPCDLPEVARFVQDKYMQVFGTLPLISGSEICLCAKRRGQLAGTISIEFSDGERFNLEKLFGVDLRQRRKFAVFGKFVSEIPGLGPALAFEAVSYAIGAGKRFALCCSKPLFLEMLRRKYGLDFAIVAREINHLEISAGDAAFFETDPRPCLYSWNLQGWHDILKEKMPPWVEIDLPQGML